MSQSHGRVLGLFSYPVKSMQGERLTEAAISPDGIYGDRRWAVLDVETGKIASAKNPRKWRRLLECQARYLTTPVEGQPLPDIVVTLPDRRQLRSDDPRLDLALSDLFKREVRLVNEMPPDLTVEAIEGPDIADGMTVSRYARDRAFATDGRSVLYNMPTDLRTSAFWDSYELHVLTTASLRRLRQSDPQADIDVRRYRPNVLVDCPGTAFAEKEWVGSHVELAESILDVELEIPRCTMITLSQTGLRQDRNALRTIIRENTIELPELGIQTGALGVVASVSRSGIVRLGDPVHALTGAGRLPVHR